MDSIEEIGYYFLISLLAISLIILCIYLIFSCRKKPVESEETLPVKSPAQAYPLTDIDTATDGFNPRRVIGRGRLGTVYAGVLKGEGPVAVKRIHPSLVLTHVGFGFPSVLKTLSSTSHPNVVPIIGFSQAPGERIIVMELVGSVSLDYYLHSNDGAAGAMSSLLDWSRRVRVAAGAARGVEYLHGSNVVHGCVKTTNVLLDARFCPKVCDYGLSFLGQQREIRRGLLGYVDDEYWVKGGIGSCKESDVFGLGVVLLEILTGRRAEEGLLVKWAIPLIRERRFSEVLDDRIATPCDLKPIVRFAKVASSCVCNSRKSRPTIGQVASILNSLEVEVCGGGI